jgi:uncharacterized SAM-binding protein YcdF (DUF218 family)
MNDRVRTLADRIWAYHLMGQDLIKADCILVLGSHDLRVADHAADLYLEGWAPLILFSGNVGALTEGQFAQTEAEAFAGVALQKGVPEADILLEPRATNTGENIRFSREILEQDPHPPQRLILVQKPYMERRTWATFAKVWPEASAVVTSPPIPFADYPTPEIPAGRVIEIMLGDLQRLKEYPAKGFMIEQDIPEDVWDAFEELVDLGFDGHLLT